MDKEQATDLIIQAIDKEWSHEEIVKFMLLKLKVPPDLIEKFVSQVEDQHPRPLPQFEPEPEPAPAQLPPWLQDESAEPTYPPPDLAADSTWSPAAPVQADSPSSPEPSSFSSQSETPTPQPANQELYRPKRPNPFKDPEVAAEYSRFVVSELRKSRKRTDVIAAICEKTGAEWGLVQRFVSQVETQHHSQITTPKTLVTMILAALFIIVGLVIILLDLQSLITLGNVILGQPGSLLPSVQYILGTIGQFVLGFSLVMGGAIGILLMLRPIRR